MNSPTIYSVDYFDFMTALRKATNLKLRIDKTEKQRWADYVRSNKIPEAAMGKRAESMSVGGRIETVIITGYEGWEGYYVYSRDDQYCVKYDIGGE